MVFYNYYLLLFVIISFLTQNDRSFEKKPKMITALYVEAMTNVLNEYGICAGSRSTGLNKLSYHAPELRVHQLANGASAGFERKDPDSVSVRIYTKSLLARAYGESLLGARAGYITPK
eukprot:SAG31_NODE_1272_length_9064_cov_5.201004_8_plen_118_part_00